MGKLKQKPKPKALAKVGRPRTVETATSKGWVPRFLIREVRIARGLKQHDLARRLRVSVHSIPNWENGLAVPHWGKLDTIGVALGCSRLGDLVDLDSEFEQDYRPAIQPCDPVSVKERHEINKLAAKARIKAGGSSRAGWVPRFWISKLRIQKGLTQAEFGKMIGTAAVHVSFFEHGAEAPSWANLYRIGKVLGCKTVGELVDRDSLFGQHNAQPSESNKDY